MIAARRNFAVYVAVAALAVLSVVAISGFDLLGPRTSMLIDNNAQLAAGALATFCCLYTAWREPTRRAWRVLIGIGMACWTLGQGIWGFYRVVWGQKLTCPSWADLALLLPLFAIPALVRFGGEPHRSALPTPRLHAPPKRGSGYVLVLDGLIVAGSLAILTWSTALGAVVNHGARNSLALAVATAYPLLDVVVFVMVALLVGSGWVRSPYRRQLSLLGLGLICLAVSDSIFAYVFASGADDMRPLADVGFVAGPVIISLAALAPENTRSRFASWPSAQPPGWGQLLLPYLPVAATGVLVIYQTAAGDGPSKGEVYGAFVVVLLVVMRQLITMRDNARLLVHLREGQQWYAYQAFHDPLTGLPNRALFHDRLVHATELHRRDQRPLALMFIDLDDFKAINDSRGHAAGDELLKGVGARLATCVRSADTVARLGGDEFAILLEGDFEDPSRVGERVLAVLREPFAVGGAGLTIGASLGVVTPDHPSVSADALLSRADAAMYSGKRRGKSTLVVYQPGSTEQPDLIASLAATLRGDSDATPLDLRYQPIVRLGDGATVAVEATARWSTVDGGLAADALSETADRAGLRRELDEMVLDRACADIAGFRRGSRTGVAVHVNVCASRLGDPHLESCVHRSLRRHRLPAEALVLEILDADQVADLAKAAVLVQRLRRRGVRIALESGAGHPTLAHIHMWRAQTIKLDRALALADGNGEALRRSLTAIAYKLGVQVVAEGVETTAQAAELLRMGFPLGQGYLFGGPVPVSQLRTPPPAFAAILQARHWPPASRSGNDGKGSGPGGTSELLQAA